MPATWESPEAVYPQGLRQAAELACALGTQRQLRPPNYQSARPAPWEPASLWGHARSVIDDIVRVIPIGCEQRRHWLAAGPLQ